MGHRRTLGRVVAAFSVAVAGALSPPAAGGATTPAAHIAVVVMENHEFDQIHGSTCCPYMNSLAARFSDFRHFYAITHPSLPNYLALTGGSTFGRTNDDTSKLVRGDNLFSQLQAAGISWKAYEEDMPSPCFKGSTSGGYALKHDPAMMYVDISSNPDACEKVVPFSQFASDLANSVLPQFAFITPNLCDDMHDCAPRIGDKWLRNNMPALLNALGPDGLLVVTFDEGATTATCCGVPGGGHIYSVVAGPGAARTSIGAPVDSYSLLRMIEDNWDLNRLRNAKSAPAMAGWQS